MDNPGTVDPMNTDLSDNADRWWVHGALGEPVDESRTAATTHSVGPGLYMDHAYAASLEDVLV